MSGRFRNRCSGIDRGIEFRKRKEHFDAKEEVEVKERGSFNKKTEEPYGSPVFHVTDFSVLTLYVRAQHLYQVQGKDNCIFHHT